MWLEPSLEPRTEMHEDHAGQSAGNTDCLALRARSTRVCDRPSRREPPGGGPIGAVAAVGVARRSPSR